MLSVVTVFNRPDVLQRCLKDSLADQSEQLEFIEVDNSSGQFDRAAAALNWGAQRASGEWVAFVHQDVHLIGENWTRNLQRVLERLRPSGWVGVMGRDDCGTWRGLMRDRDGIYGEPFGDSQEVQCLDEVVLIHRRDDLPPFDESIAGWHVYGVAACCQAKLDGHANYVVDAPVWHDSPSTNRSGLAEAHQAIADRFAEQIAPIHSCCGDIPFRFRRKGSYRKYVFQQRLRGLASRVRTGGRLPQFEETVKPLHLVDRWTLDDEHVVCWRGEASVPELDAVGLCDHTERPRRVTHYFSDHHDEANLPDEVPIIIFPDAPYNIPLPRRHGFLILDRVSLRPGTQSVRPIPQRNPVRNELCRDQDDRYWWIREFSPLEND